MEVFNFLILQKQLNVLFVELKHEDTNVEASPHTFGLEDDWHHVVFPVIAIEGYEFSFIFYDAKFVEVNIDRIPITLMYLIFRLNLKNSYKTKIKAYMKESRAFQLKPFYSRCWSCWRN